VVIFFLTIDKKEEGGTSFVDKLAVLVLPVIVILKSQMVCMLIYKEKGVILYYGNKGTSLFKDWDQCVTIRKLLESFSIYFQYQ
jgi:hypothetical protein